MRTAAVSRYLFYPLALIGASLAAPALAAPQILAVAATELPLPLTCEAGECRVELTTICLQEERASPNPGAGYYVHGDRFFEITGLTETGQEISLAHPRAGAEEIWPPGGQPQGAGKSLARPASHKK